VMRSSTPSRAAGIVRRSEDGGCWARAVLLRTRMRRSAQRYRAISDDVMRWNGRRWVGRTYWNGRCSFSYDDGRSSVSWTLQSCQGPT